VSIVIPTLGRTASLRDVVAALGEQQPPLGDAEVIVVLDAHGPEDSVAGLAAPVDITLRASVAGASGARNAGWQAASAPLVLFLDDDIVPSRRLVDEHLRWHRQHPEPQVGVLGVVKWSPQVKVTPFMRWLESGIQFDFDRIESTEVGWQLFYSCNVSVKREMLALVGGFDAERFPYGYEDLELARRLSDHDFRLLYNPAALGYHLKVETLEGWKRNLPRIARSERRFVSLYPGERAYFYELFRRAAEQPRAHGRSARLTRWIRPGFPLVGDLAWRSYDVVCSQRLAPEFLLEWERAGAEAAE
jgi:GT2 family glycosyltransferase